jgi:hypothetical protein
MAGQNSSSENWLKRKVSAIPSLPKLFWDWFCKKILKEAWPVYIFLAIGLWSLSYICPESYNFLTEWIDAPRLPTIKSCHIRPLESPLAAFNGPNAYRITLNVTSVLRGSFDLLIKAKTASVSVYEPDRFLDVYNERRDHLLRNFISRDRFKEKSLALDVLWNHQLDNTQEFSERDLDLTDCPVDLLAFKRGK